VGDDDGLIVAPRERAVEIANRGMEKLEAEQRIIREIESGRSLGEVANLARWDKYARQEAARKPPDPGA
jgi:3-hexulose-6-phosphate synthase/6-phospho-3-hexuloisomerase